jgi:protein TonB
VQRVNVTEELAPVAASPETPPAEPQQAPGLPRDALREHYLSQNFRGIRERINAGLVYPTLARKMGWSGRVVVSFVVLTDGEVKDVRVREGCGHEVLDRSAVETVKRCAPYPPPPAESELLVPIIYRLE